MPPAAPQELPDVARHEREQRRAAADGKTARGADQVLRIRRGTGPTNGPWESKEIAYGITSLPPDLAGPRQLSVYAPAASPTPTPASATS